MFPKARHNTLSAPYKHCYSVLLLVFMFAIPIFGYDKEMTVYIDAGKIDCFFHSVKEGETIDIEYQVIDGGHGDLDITFTLLDPIGVVIVSDFKKPDNLHRHDALKTGDYRFCFDNSFSTFNRKTVFFELIIERNGEQAQDNIREQLDGLTLEEFYEIKVSDINDYIDRIRMQLTRARQLQDNLRANEARDRNLAEANFLRVNAWSVFQTLAMLLVGLLQVFMVRSIFETNTRMSKLWQKLSL